MTNGKRKIFNSQKQFLKYRMFCLKMHAVLLKTYLFGFGKVVKSFVTHQNKKIPGFGYAFKSKSKLY